MSRWHLECSACDHTADGRTIASVCPRCGQPLLVRYDSAWPARERIAPRWDMWRYRDVLPIDDAEVPVQRVHRVEEGGGGAGGGEGGGDLAADDAALPHPGDDHAPAGGRDEAHRGGELGAEPGGGRLELARLEGQHAPRLGVQGVVSEGCHRAPPGSGSAPRRTRRGR